MSVPALDIDTANAVLLGSLITAGRADDWAALSPERQVALLSLGALYLNDNFEWVPWELDTDGNAVIPVEVQRAQCWAALHVLRTPDLHQPTAQTTSLSVGPIRATSQPVRRPHIPRHLVDAVGCYGRPRRVRHHVRFP